MRHAMLASILFASTLLVACAPADTDGDGILDKDEVAAGTDPDKADTDGDGLSDSAEVTAGTDPQLADTDGDGLADGDELAGGTDPLVADTDGDTLADGAEAAAGADPLVADTDGDGYLDGWEVSAGSDPADADSLIYKGGWPYNPNKDAVAEPEEGSRLARGAVVPHFVFPDQFGDLVDIYDFAYQGKPMIIDLSGAWCYWCQQVAMAMEGESSAFDGNTWPAEIAEMLETDQAYWITILDADEQGAAPTQAVGSRWYRNFPNPNIAVLVDEQGVATEWFHPLGYPTAILVEEDMTVAAYSPSDYRIPFSQLANRAQ